ncbi:ComEC family competence protein [Andreesenia angusta]|uniref:ComEC family competence protein n=1 Tax=Andreesenia angusta TaxID=39480 RepID=A0A1S1V7Q5_9FIRM|nr:DNA internalization-related competence protein ComEC/Rec2 [Andreesenia angusta]OHW62544.1 ComEC family competence protein [Andreesenia angusta]
MKKPFLSLWIAYIIGIYLDYNYDIQEDTYIYLLGMIGAAFLGARILLNKTLYTLVLMLSLLMGGLFFNTDYMHGREDGFGEDVEIEVKVLRQKISDEEYERYIVEDLENREKLALTFYENIGLNVGDVLNASGELKAIGESRNPKLFSSRDYYRSLYVYGNMVASAKDIEVIEKGSLNYVERASLKFRNYVEKVLESSVSSEYQGILKSMVLGDSGYIEELSLERIRDLGLGHMIAVSGLHIGIVFGALFHCFRSLLEFHKRLAEFMGIALIWVYIALIGSPVSSIRAGIMISLLILSKLLHRRRDALNTVAFAGLSMLVAKPLWALSLGYQLSFAGVIALSVFRGKKLKSLFGIFLGLLPLNMYYFNTIPLVSLFTNLAVAPLLSLALLLSFGLLSLYGLSASLALLFGGIIDMIMASSSWIMDILESQHNPIYAKSPELLAMMVFYIILLVLAEIIDVERFGRKTMTVFVSYTVLSAGIMLSTPVEQSYISFIDVGQGDCAHIEVSGKNYMVDSGGSVYSDYDVGEHVVYPYLLKHGVDELDGFIVSHFDADHMKGFLYVMDHIEVKEIIIGYESPENELYLELLEKANANGTRVSVVENVEELRLDAENRMVFIPPKESDLKAGENNSSLVVLLESYGNTALFTGDIESEREMGLSELGLIRDVDMIKVPHHGSATSSTERFLEAVNPEIAIFQVGKNSFGHPNKDVLNRYDKLGSEIYRNDESGMVKLTLGRDMIEVWEYLEKKPGILESVLRHRWKLTATAIQSIIWIWMIYDVKRRAKNREEQLEDLDWTTESF